MYFVTEREETSNINRAVFDIRQMIKTELKD